MKYKAHEYQQYATDFILEHPVSCLILDMGLGKTVITLTALWLLLFDYFEVSRILIIAPKRVAENTWPVEITKWEHLAGLEFSAAMGRRSRDGRHLNGKRISTSSGGTMWHGLQSSHYFRLTWS